MSPRQLPSGESFLAAVIQDDRDVVAFAYDQLMMLIDRTPGDTRQVDSIAVTPSTLNLWLLTGYLHLRRYAVELDLKEMATMQASNINSDSEMDSGTYSESDTRMLRGKTVDAVAIPLIDSECSSEEDDSTDNDTDLGHNTSYSSDEDETNDLEPIVGQRRRPWTGSEEDLLRKCVGQKEQWDETGRRLDRSASAVRQHWRLMQDKGRKGKPRIGSRQRRAQ